MSHETAKNAKHTLAPNSLPEYLNILAASMNTSLTSWRARVMAPSLKKL